MVLAYDCTMESLEFATHPPGYPAFVIDDRPGFERLSGFKCDTERLKDHVQKVCHKLPKVAPGDKYGGWSVWSSNGHYNDGWEYGHTCYTERDGKQVYDAGKARRIGLRHVSEYRIPTEICHGYLARPWFDCRNLGWFCDEYASS